METLPEVRKPASQSVEIRKAERQEEIIVIAPKVHDENALPLHSKVTAFSNLTSWQQSSPDPGRCVPYETTSSRSSNSKTKTSNIDQSSATPDSEVCLYLKGRRSTSFTRGSEERSGTPHQDENEHCRRYVPEPERRPITVPALAREVACIYAGLEEAEAECIEMDGDYATAFQNEGPSLQVRKQRESLIERHDILLSAYYDFLLAIQHPSVHDIIRKFATYSSIPGRMWHHGIYTFLDLLRVQLPESLDSMLMFTYTAYKMMTIFFETITLFKDVWTEFLGDLSRYLMVIEQEFGGRETWNNVARSWYTKISNQIPGVGRLSHHIAVLAPFQSLQQLSLYTISLTCVTPYPNARRSVLEILEKPDHDQLPSLEATFIKTQGLLFCKGTVDNFNLNILQIRRGLLNNYIQNIAVEFKRKGVFMAVVNIAAFFEYGSKSSSKSFLRLIFQEFNTAKARKIKIAQSPQLSNNPPNVNDNEARTTYTTASHPLLKSLTSSEIDSSLRTILLASCLTFTMLSIAMRRIDDKNVLPFVHISFVFLWSLTSIKQAINIIEQDVPWNEVCSFLNALSLSDAVELKCFTDEYLKSNHEVLPEDFVMRGQIYSQWYFSEAWFDDEATDEDERLLELPSTHISRVERILWLGARIASVCLTCLVRGSALTRDRSIGGYIMMRSPENFRSRKLGAHVLNALFLTFLQGP